MLQAAGCGSACASRGKKNCNRKWKGPVESNPWRPTPKSCLKIHVVLCVKRLNMPLKVGKKGSLCNSAEAIVSVLKTSASLSASSWMSASSLWCNSDSSHLKKPRRCEHADGVDTWGGEPNVEMSSQSSPEHVSSEKWVMSVSNVECGIMLTHRSTVRSYLCHSFKVNDTNQGSLTGCWCCSMKALPGPRLKYWKKVTLLIESEIIYSGVCSASRCVASACVRISF